MKTKRIKAFFLISIVLALQPYHSETEAATATDSFNVTAVVAATANVSANDLNFGTVNPSVATIASTIITVQVTDGTSYTVALSSGANASFPSRRMLDSSAFNYLEYNLYTDISHSTTWGDGSGGPGTTPMGTGNGLNQMYTVYGRIPAGQMVPAGIYTDTITVIVEY